MGWLVGCVSHGAQQANTDTVLLQPGHTCWTQSRHSYVGGVGGFMSAYLCTILGTCFCFPSARKSASPASGRGGALERFKCSVGMHLSLERFRPSGIAGRSCWVVNDGPNGGCRNRLQHATPVELAA